jgi:hypothetical protein
LVTLSELPELLGAKVVRSELTYMLVRDEIERTLQSLGEKGTPALFRVELVIDSRVVEDETLVRTPSTYEGVLTNRNYRRRT